MRPTVVNKTTESFFFWRILQQYSSFFVKIIIQVVLARILCPEDFGTVAIISVFTGIAEILAISGLGASLVQNKEIDQIDYSTVLCTSVVFSSILYLLLFACAPMIANYYEDPSLLLLTRIMGISLFPQSYLSVLTAYVQKNYEFKKSCIGTVLSVIIAGITSIILAYHGWGAWSIVLFTLLTSVLSVIIIQLLISWHPGFSFNYVRNHSREWEKGIISFNLLQENMFLEHIA